MTSKATLERSVVTPCSLLINHVSKSIGTRINMISGIAAPNRERSKGPRRDPIIAAAITNIGLLLVCLLPLVLCWYLLHRRVEPADDQAVAEVLLEDLVTNRPLLLPRSDNVRAIGVRTRSDDSSVPDDVDDVEHST